MHCNKSFTILMLFSLTISISDGNVAKSLMILLVSPVKDILLCLSFWDGVENQNQITILRMN